MQLDDAHIIEIIAELAARHSRVGIPALRNALRQRHAVSCGTDRLSKLLKQYRQGPAKAERFVNLPAVQSPTSDEHGTAEEVAKLEASLKALNEALAKERSRAELAEYRETAHQDKWAGEIYELRARLALVSPERAAATARECEYLRVQNRHLTRLVADLKLALAQTQLEDKDPA